MADPSEHERNVAGTTTPRIAPVDVTVRSSRLVRTVLGVCITAELAFVLLDYHVNYGGPDNIGALRRLANIAREDSLASWFGTTQTLLIAMTLWAIVVVIRRRTSDRRRRAGWLVLASFFSFMAVDDGSLLHERVGTAFSEIHSVDADDAAPTSLGGRVVEAFPSYTWQIVVLPWLVVLGLFLLGFLWWELDRPWDRLVVALALAGLSIAVGLDFFEGLEPDHPWNPYSRIRESIELDSYTVLRFRHDAYETLRHFSKSIEEFLEMLSGTLLWSVFLRTLARVTPDTRIRFE